MRISQRLSRIKPSATLAINTKAQELRAAGQTVTSLAVGEPDFGTPEHIGRAACQAIEEGFTRYTPVPGIPELRQAAAEYFNRFYDAGADKEAVIVSNGGKQCLFNLLQALIDPGDEVLVPTPYWVSYPALVMLAEGEPVFVPAPVEKDFLIEPADLDKALTPRTKVLILNTPSNPTGCHYTPGQLDALAAWAVDKGVFVIADEIYDRLVYPPSRPASLSAWWKKHPENFAVVNGLSKTFAMTGWRVGYVLAHPDLIKVLSKIQGQSTSNICSIAQKAALAALTGPFEPVEEMRRAFARRRDLALEKIREWPGVVCPKPDGAFYLFPKLSSHYSKDIPDSTAFCTKVLEKLSIALVPGAAFGDDECVRFSYALDDDTLTDCLERIGGWLQKR